MVDPKMPVSLSLVACLILLAVVEPASVRGDPDPMARPTRPKVFTSPEELRRYLDLVKDYYSLSGKARYGKRAQALSFGDYPWDVVRIPQSQATMLALRQQLQDQQTPNKHEMQREQNQQREPRQSDLGGQQQSYLYDMMAKYYDDLQ